MAQFGSNESDAGGDDGLRDHGFGQESEIYFKGSTKILDDTVKVGVSVDLEGETAGDQIDNTYIWASGSFGRVEYGETWGPSLIMNYGGVGEKNHTGDFASFNPQTSLSGVALNSFGGSAGVNSLPSEKLAYYTPRMSGVQIGVSYAPEPKNGSANGVQDADNGVAGAVQRGSELIDLGVNYVGKIGGGNIGVYGSTWTSNTEPGGTGGAGDADVEGYGVGGQVSMSNVTVGGKYTKIEDFAGRGLDKTTWRVGATYGMGAWSFGATYQNGEQDRAVSSDEVSYWSIGAQYSVGPGVDMGVGIVNYTFDDDAGAAANEGDNNFGIIWTKLAF